MIGPRPNGTENRGINQTASSHPRRGRCNDNEAPGYNSVPPPCYDLRKGPRNTATPGRLPMMHVPEVRERPCTRIMLPCNAPPLTTVSVYRAWIPRPRVMTLSYLCPRPAVLGPRERRNPGGTVDPRTDRGRIFDERLVISGPV